MVTKKKPEDKPAPSDADDSGIIDIGPDADAPKPKDGLLKNRKLLIIVAGAVLLLGGGGGAALFLMGGADADHAKAEDGHGEHAEGTDKAEEEAEAEGEGEGEGKDGELPIVDVPPLVVNLRTADGTPRYLKIRFMLEAKSAAKTDKLKDKLPAIIDAYQPFLRELRPEDVSGSAAVFRIKEELLVRATEAAGKGMVKDVLIQDLVQQ